VQHSRPPLDPVNVSSGVQLPRFGPVLLSCVSINRSRILGFHSFFQSSALAASTELHAKQYVTTVSPKPGGGGLPQGQNQL